MRVRERIIDVLPVAPELDKVRKTQALQLMRHRRFRQIQQGRQVAHAQLPLFERMQDHQPRRIAEQLEQIGQIEVFLLIQQILLHSLDRAFMDTFVLAYRQTIHRGFSLTALIVEQSFNYLQYRPLYENCQGEISNSIASVCRDYMDMQTRRLFPLPSPLPICYTA